LEYEFPRLGLVHYRDLYDPTENIADILSAISRAKDEVVDEQEYARLAAAMLERAATDEERLAAEKAVEVARVYAAYEAIKRKSNCIDFGDLVSKPVRLLEQDATIRDYCQQRYDHVLVDEYQDVNRSSVRLLVALRSSGENLWAVGDARQSIYRFRGASSFNLTRFGKEDFPGGERGWLDVNYRSVAEIVAAFSSFASAMKVGSMAGTLTANRGTSGEPPQFRTVLVAEEQPVALTDRIAELRSKGYTYRDNAVLCTGNEALANLGQDLERLGLPVLYLGSLFERAEVKDLLSLLSLLVDRRAMGLTRLACLPEFKMTAKDVAAMLDHLRANETAPGAWLRSPPVGLSSEGLAVVARLSDVLRGFSADAAPWTVLVAMLLDRTRLAANLAGSAQIADKARGIALWQFLNFVRVQPAGAGLPIQRLLDRVRRL
jgi:superfamily I DNA/RNA helicase